MKKIIIAAGFLSILLFSSCESKQSQAKHLAGEEQQKTEQETVKSKENTRVEQNVPAGKEGEIDGRYIKNSLQTGTMPYRRYYGNNLSCKGLGCSQIKVTTPNNSDVLVTIKSNDKVVCHAYIHSDSSYTFEMPNGTYQSFFYFGKGWNPDKEMKRADNTSVLGGFVSNELFGKDSPKNLDNNILEYQLILQQNGNFNIIPSSSMEAL